MLPTNQYEIILVIEVDGEANFLEVGNGDNEDVVLEVIKDTLYDIDEVKVIDAECEVV